MLLSVVASYYNHPGQKSLKHSAARKRPPDAIIAYALNKSTEFSNTDDIPKVNLLKCWVITSSLLP